jgi:aminopeptidase N
LFEAQFVPTVFWNSLPLNEMEAWIKAHVPAEMGPQIQKGMDSARFQYTQKQELVPAADAYLAARGSHA